MQVAAMHTRCRRWFCDELLFQSSSSLPLVLPYQYHSSRDNGSTVISSVSSFTIHSSTPVFSTAGVHRVQPSSSLIQVAVTSLNAPSRCSVSVAWSYPKPLSASLRFLFSRHARSLCLTHSTLVSSRCVVTEMKMLTVSSELHHQQLRILPYRRLILALFPLAHAVAKLPPPTVTLACSLTLSVLLISCHCSLPSLSCFQSFSAFSSRAVPALAGVTALASLLLSSFLILVIHPCSLVACSMSQPSTVVIRSANSHSQRCVFTVSP